MAHCSAADYNKPFIGVSIEFSNLAMDDDDDKTELLVSETDENSPESMESGSESREHSTTSNTYSRLWEGNEGSRFLHHYRLPRKLEALALSPKILRRKYIPLPQSPKFTKMFSLNKKKATEISSPPYEKQKCVPLADEKSENVNIHSYEKLKFTSCWPHNPNKVEEYALLVDNDSEGGTGHFDYGAQWDGSSANQHQQSAAEGSGRQDDFLAVHHILSLLVALKSKLQETSEGELETLRRLFRNDVIQKAVVLNEKISTKLRENLKSSKPLGTNSSVLAAKISSNLKTSNRSTMKEETTHTQQAFHIHSTGKLNQAISSDETGTSFDTALTMSHDLFSGTEESDGGTRDKENNVNIGKERGQLVDILESPHISAVLNAHDKVALLQRKSDQSECIPMAVMTKQDGHANSQSDTDMRDTNGQSDVDLQTDPRVESSFIKGDRVKSITLHKDSEPLGATVRNEGDAVVIARIVKGGVAERTKLLKQGDEILRINDMDIRGKTIDQVADIMGSLSGELRLTTKPSVTSACLGAAARHVPRRDITVRAQFDYEAADDPFIPCVELGVSFKIGDILHVSNRDDPHWWQAHREGDDPESLAGLIPSRLFWETREQVSRAIIAESEAVATKRRHRLTCCPGGGRQRSRRKLSSKHEVHTQSVDADSMLTYEEVGWYHPLPNKKRPIVLVGCEELRLQRICTQLMTLDKPRFGQPIRTSSRPSMFTSDKQAPLLQFLPHDKFIEKIKVGEFIEYKVVDIPEMHYIGVSLRSVRDVIESGATCITHCQPKNITKLRTREIKPYVVFVAAPPIQRLRTYLRSESTIEPTNEECKHIIDLSRYNETTYTHLYDHVMTVTDLEQACTELVTQINALDEDKQWVPIEWVPQQNGKTNSNYSKPNRVSIVSSKSGNTDTTSMDGSKVAECRDSILIDTLPNSSQAIRHSVIADVCPANSASDNVSVAASDSTATGIDKKSTDGTKNTSFNLTTELGLLPGHSSAELPPSVDLQRPSVARSEGRWEEFL